MSFFLSAIAFAGLSYLLTRVLIRFSHRMESLEKNEITQVRWASQTKPLVGGISLYLVMLLAVIMYVLVDGISSGDTEYPSILPLLIAATLGFLVGLADDAYTTKPMAKLAGQILCGVILCVFGVYIQLFDNMMLNYTLTVIWVVGMMNSVNMIDNMDGVTGGMAVGVFVTSILVMFTTGTLFSIEGFVVVSLLGATIGFLFLNWKPAKTYIGDTGTMFLGVLYAYYGIELFWNSTTPGGEYVFTRQVLLPILVFLMPLLDTTFVTIYRLSIGQSPMVGGNQHTTHHLYYLGMDERMVAIVTFTVTLLSGLMALSIILLTDSWTHLHTALYGGYVLAICGLFILVYRRGGHNLRIREAQKAALAAEARSKNRDAVRELAHAHISEN